MGRPDYIFCQFRVTARCRDAQHGDGVYCAFAPQLVMKFDKDEMTFEKNSSLAKVFTLQLLSNYVFI